MRSRSWPDAASALEVRPVPVALGDHHLDQRDALDQLRRQDARRRVVAVHAGDPLELVAPGVLVEQHGLAGLDEVVELVRRPARELVDDLAALRRRRTPRLRSSSQVTEYMRWMSAWRISRMCGRWTLTATRSPLCRIARWTWPIDAAANDCRSNDREDDLGLAAELAPDDRADLLVAERRDLVEQPEQLVAVRDRQQVVAQREHLAELHPRPAELLERDPHPDRSGPLVGARQVERGRDEQPEEDGQDVADPSGVPEQVPHAAVGRSVAERPALAAALREAAGPIGQSVVVVERDATATARHRRLLLPLAARLDQLGEEVPRPRVHEAHRALGGELALAARSGGRGARSRRSCARPRRRSRRQPRCLSLRRVRRAAPRRSARRATPRAAPAPWRPTRRSRPGSAPPVAHQPFVGPRHRRHVAHVNHPGMLAADRTVRSIRVYRPAMTGRPAK